MYQIVSDGVEKSHPQAFIYETKYKKDIIIQIILIQK